MKGLLVFCVVACLVLVSLAKDLKDVRAEAAKKKGCISDCDSQEYKPICAKRDGSKALSFGNVCVMNHHNCENEEGFQKLSDGECPGGGSVRLS